MPVTSHLAVSGWWVATLKLHRTHKKTAGNHVKNNLKFHYLE